MEYSIVAEVAVEEPKFVRTTFGVKEDRTREGGLITSEIPISYDWAWAKKGIRNRAKMNGPMYLVEYRILPLRMPHKANFITVFLGGVDIKNTEKHNNQQIRELSISLFL